MSAATPPARRCAPWPKDALRISYSVIWLPYTSGSSDIGTAVIYAVVFAGLLALSYYAGPARYSADYYLEKKISWWWKVAEVRRPGSGQPVTAAPVPGQTAAVTPATVPQPRTAEPAEHAEPAGRRSA